MTGFYSIVFAISVLFSVLFASLFNGLAMAQLQEDYFLQFQSSFLEVVTDHSKYRVDGAGEYPFWARAIRGNFFKWDPSGRSERVSEDCNFTQQQEKYFSPQADSLSFLQDYFGRCEKKLQTGANSFLFNVYHTNFIRLNPSSHPFAKHVIFHLPNGVLLKGLLALKGDATPRPLVILRLGVFSNSQEFFPERYMFLQMFEQSPFNMLILESMSGTEFLQNNTRYSMGGFDEGIQNYQVAAQISKSSEPLSKLIDSIHMFGISLGGHGVLYASLLNQLNPKVISSFATFCPLVNFKETFEYHQTHGINMKIMSYWAQKRMNKITEIFPQLTAAEAQADFIPSVLASIEGSYTEGLSLSKEEYPAEHPGERLILPASAGSKGFFSKNQFWSDFHDLQTPMLIFATQKDPIVPFELNSLRFLTGEIPLKNVKVAVISLEQGFHCTIPTAYNWKAWTQIMQSYVLKNSKVILQSHRLQLSSAFRGDEEVSFEVNAQGLFAVQGHWWNQKRFQIPLEQTEWSDLHLPLGESTQSMLRRWMEQSLSVQRVVGGESVELVWQSLK